MIFYTRSVSSRNGSPDSSPCRDLAFHYCVPGLIPGIAIWNVYGHLVNRVVFFFPRSDTYTSHHFPPTTEHTDGAPVQVVPTLSLCQIEYDA